MARTFLVANSDRITLADETAFDIEFSQAFTVAARVRPTTAGLFGSVCAKEDETGAGDGGPLGWMAFQRSGTTGPQWAFALDGGNATRVATRMTSDGIAFNTWRHVAWVSTGTGTVAGLSIYEDGVSQALTTIADTLAGSTILNNVSARIGCRENVGTPSFFFSGDVAELAIWLRALSLAEIQSLADGFSPSLIPGADRLSYLPLVGNASPEQDLWGGHNGTLTGTTKADHPRVILPSRKAVYSGRAA